MHLRLLLILALTGTVAVASPTVLDRPPLAAYQDTATADTPDEPKPYTTEIPALGCIGIYPLHQKDWACAPDSNTYLLADEFGRFCTNAVEQYLDRHDPATAAIRRNNRAAHLEYVPRGHLFFNMDNTIEWYLASTCTKPGKGGDIGARGTCRYIIEKNRIVLEYTVKSVSSTLRLPIDNTASPSGKGKLCLDLTDPVFGKNIYPEIPVVIEKQTPPGTVVQKTPFTRFGTDDTYNHNVIETSWNDDETAVLVTQHWKWHSEIYLYAETADHRYIRSGNLSEECSTAIEQRIHATLPDFVRKRAKIATTYPYTLQGAMKCTGNQKITWQMDSYMPKNENMNGNFHTEGAFHYSVKAGKLCLAPDILTLQPAPEQTLDEQPEEEEKEDLCDIILRMYSE